MMPNILFDPTAAYSFGEPIGSSVRASLTHWGIEHLARNAVLFAAFFPIAVKHLKFKALGAFIPMLFLGPMIAVNIFGPLVDANVVVVGASGGMFTLLGIALHWFHEIGRERIGAGIVLCHAVWHGVFMAMSGSYIVTLGVHTLSLVAGYAFGVAVTQFKIPTFEVEREVSA